MLAAVRLSLAGIVAIGIMAIVLVSSPSAAAEGDASDVDELDLARMMLPPDGLEPEVGDFLVPSFVGYSTHPESGIDRGYTMVYLNPTTYEGTGVTSVGLAAALYGSTTSASTDLSNAIEELQPGKELAPGVTIEDATPFAVSGLGDEAFGVVLRLEWSGNVLFATDVSFRLDRLVGGILVAHLDDTDFRGRTAQIAQQLSERMKGVLTGEVTEIAAPLPPDVNCAAGANSVDAALLLQFDAGLVSTLPCEFLADANGDGSVNAIDAAIVLQLDGGLIVWPLS